MYLFELSSFGVARFTHNPQAACSTVQSCSNPRSGQDAPIWEYCLLDWTPSKRLIVALAHCCCQRAKHQIFHMFDIPVRLCIILHFFVTIQRRFVIDPYCCHIRVPSQRFALFSRDIHPQALVMYASYPNILHQMSRSLVAHTLRIYLCAVPGKPLLTWT